MTAIPGQTDLKDSPEGYLYVVLRGEQYDNAETLARSSYLLRMSGWAMAASLGFGLLAGLVVFHLLTRRLRRLTERMEQFAQQSIQPEAAVCVYSPPGDEVETLTLTFERMAERIGQQIEQLQQQDGLRRRLVAQVSHDLRTPLASMQGYLAMEKHRLKAQNQGVTMRLSLLPGSPLVFGDIGMTERVLDNLLDNAIRHTPAEGRICVSATTEAGRIRVSITDSGPGIAVEQLPHLFDPFYRGGSSDSSGQHAGLGLAIAKRIMELQNGSISAENVSSEGGSRFSFWLPLNSG